MLSIEEMNWNFSDLKVVQYIELSNLITQLIMLRLFFYSHYIQKVMDRISSISLFYSRVEEKEKLGKMVTKLESVKKMAEEFEQEL